jgi:putative ABC transport system substrate-binding protein
MNRRNAARAILLSPLAFGAAPRATRAQTGRVYRRGYLSQPTRQSVERPLEAFLRALRDLGWVEGRNLVIEYRWAEGDTARLPALADDLVRRGVDVIVAPAGTAALAAKNATREIPIVMIFPSAPVESGLVSSLSRPGGNVTGTTYATGPEIFGKQVQLLKEAVPHARRFAMLGNPADAWVVQGTEVRAAVRAMGLRLQEVSATRPEEFAAAFGALTRERAEALVVAGSSTYLVYRAALVEHALKARLPTMFNFREMVDAGGLMAYAVNMTAFIGRAAVYVDRILKGAKPADLPIEQPTKFELVINVKTAKALRLALSPALLQRADGLVGQGPPQQSCARATASRRAGRRRTPRNEDPRVRIGDRHAGLVRRGAVEHDDAAILPRLVEELGDRPRRRQRVAGAHRRDEARAVLEIRDRRPVKVHADRCAHDRRRQHAMEDRRAEARAFRVFCVHVMRIEVTDQPGAQHDVRLRHRERARECVADPDVVEPPAAAVERVHPRAGGACARSRASSPRQSSVNAMPA